jgi:hypothetical protein
MSFFCDGEYCSFLKFDSQRELNNHRKGHRYYKRKIGEDQKSEEFETYNDIAFELSNEENPLEFTDYKNPNI